nr:MAG: hypothetical protein DIU68_16095 [Chloroflexota bacterium]
MWAAAPPACPDIIARANPELAVRLHEGHDVRPYTASGLFYAGSAQPVWGELQPGEQVWLRLTALNRDVAAALDAFARQIPQHVEINRTPWVVEDAVWDGHLWAGRTSYAALIHESMTAPPSNRIPLDFATPTAFHRAGLNVPLPLPDLVFGSLSTRWTAFTGAALAEELPAFIQHRVVVSRHRIETQLLHFKQGSKQVGFVGQVTFEITRRSRELETSDPALAARLDAGHDDLTRTLGLLARFSRYSGIGIKTTSGMGMARARLD